MKPSSTEFQEFRKSAPDCSRERGTEILETLSSLSLFRKAHLKETSVRKLCSPGDILGYYLYTSIDFSETTIAFK